jgi:nucleoside-diphosphate-sugar epimerase
MQRAFVTGGSGFLGKALLAELTRRQVAVRALARSEAARAAVVALGAEPVTGDLDDSDAMRAGMSGCDVVIHAAAYAKDHGPREEFFRANVQGTENVLLAARGAGVPRLVHVSTEAVLADGHPIVRADEARPYPKHPAGLYPLTKGIAEQRVRAASNGGLETVVVRPRFIWGRGDTTVVPVMIDAVKKGRWRWIAGGHYLTSTCHVDNVVEGVLAAATRGAPGGVYFLTDGPPVEFRGFIADLLRASGVDPGDRTVPRWAARMLSRIPGAPITRTGIALMSHEVTVVDQRARNELGYTGGKSIAAGLAELKA